MTEQLMIRCRMPVTGLCALGLASGLLLTGCGGEQADPFEGRDPDQSYSTRGEVTRLPDARGDLRIHHEAIPEFVNIDGETVGMGAMEMEFPHLAPEVSLGGRQVGDIVSFDFDVYWDDLGPEWRITRLERLDDPDPPLDLTGGRSRGRSYTVRGEIVQLPDPDNPMAEFQVRHEAIDDFVNRQGEVVGMNAMTMGFPALASDVSLDDLTIGGKVEMTFTVDWTNDPAMVVRRIETLDPDTPLEFREARPDGG